jgi:hypothetical protein
MSAYPEGFRAWPLDERNAYFADKARAHDEGCQNGEVKDRPALRLASTSEGLTEPPPSAPLDQLPDEYGGQQADCVPPEEPHTFDESNPPPEDQPNSYPIDALGPILGPAAHAIAEKVQCAIEMAAQSVLGVASLAAQGLSDVQTPMGQTRPLSVFFVTVAESGDRKTTADREAMVPVRMYEKKLSDQYAILKEIFDRNHAAWEAQHAQITRGKMELAERVAQLKALGPAPEPPIQPVVTISEGTVEGLIKVMPALPGSMGMFSAEGAQLLHGYGFGDDAKRRSAATFSTFWDGESVKRARAGAAEVIIIKGRRLALHLMIQPDGARAFLSDPILRDQGLLSRILVAAPDSLAGGREWKAPAQKLDAALSRYAARILGVFEVIPSTGDKLNELTPSSIALSPEALKIWVEFYNEVECDMRAGRLFAEMRDVASKAGEQAARIAGVLTIVDDRADAAAISADAMSRACKLISWYLTEALRLAEQYCVPQEVADAEKILNWCRDRRLRRVSATALLQSGPGALRRKDRMDPAIEILLETGAFTPDQDAKGKARAWIVNQEKKQ